MDLDALLQPKDDEEPSGEDLEYDLDFIELTIAATHGEEQQVGDEVLEADGPDFKEMKEKAQSVLEQSHDLRAAIYLAEAELALSGLPGFAEMTTYVARCLNEFWDTCHPQLDEDDDNDPTFRVNAVYTLADQARFIKPLRRAALTNSRTFGALSLREMEIAEGMIEPPDDMESIPDQAGVAAAFTDTSDEFLVEVSAAAKTALENINAITAKFDEETPGQGPDTVPSDTGGYAELVSTLEKINARLAAQTGDATDTADSEDEDAAELGSDAPEAAAEGAAGSGGGVIRNTRDVQNAIDRIISFYERNEPSSPVPVLLMRAKKLVGADFLAIVRDMAPGGLEHVQMIGGLEEDDD